MDRREFLQIGGVAAAAIVGGPVLSEFERLPRREIDVQLGPLQSQFYLLNPPRLHLFGVAEHQGHCPLDVIGWSGSLRMFEMKVGPRDVFVELPKSIVGDDTAFAFACDCLEFRTRGPAVARVFVVQPPRQGVFRSIEFVQFPNEQWVTEVPMMLL